MTHQMRYEQTHINFITYIHTVHTHRAFLQRHYVKNAAHQIGYRECLIHFLNVRRESDFLIEGESAFQVCGAKCENVRLEADLRSLIELGSMRRVVSDAERRLERPGNLMQHRTQKPVAMLPGPWSNLVVSEELSRSLGLAKLPLKTGSCYKRTQLEGCIAYILSCRHKITILNSYLGGLFSPEMVF